MARVVHLCNISCEFYVYISGLTHVASCLLLAELPQQVPAKIDESTGEKLYTEEQARAFAASLTVPAPKPNRKPFKKVRSSLRADMTPYLARIHAMHLSDTFTLLPL